jgi:hypothetical protein
MAKTPRIQQMTINDFEKMFPTEDACKDFLVKQRWPNGVSCPRCGNVKAYALPSRPYHWQCADCSSTGYRFSLGSSPSRVGDFGLISYRVEHAGEDFQAQVLFVA